MEERTLEELNNEYKDLVKKVGEIKIELEKAIAEKETADGNYESASANFTAKRDTYEALEAGLQKIENSGFSNALVEGMKEEIRVAKEAMEEAERVLEVRKEEQKSAKEGFEKIETASKKESSRLDVILVSFGANKTINQAISNEIEIDYSEMVEEKQKKKDEIEDLKTKISNDEKIQEKVQGLDNLLKRFEELKQNVTPENVAQLAGIGKAIEAQRRSITNRIRKEFGVKGGKISAEEIDRMTTERDLKGRIVVAELERRTETADAEIANIELEKKSLLDKMKASLEIGEQAEYDDTEVAKVKADIASLTAEKESLEKEQAQRNQRIAEIEKQKETLTEEQNSLEKGPINSAEVDKLRADKAAIEAEIVPEIDNPKKAEIRKQIEELNAKKLAGAETDVETPEYKDAKKALDIAKRNLETEKKYPRTAFAAKTDVIIDNPEYLEKNAELSLNEKNLSLLTSSIVKSNPELKKLYEDYYASKEAEEEINAKLAASTVEMLEKKNILFTEFVSDELYPDLEDNDSQTSKDFESYKQAELNLRKAMAAVQKDPSNENVESLMAAINDLKGATLTFQNTLAASAGLIDVVSPKAIHKYLLGKLNEAYYNFEPIDAGYDLNQAERRIALLEAQTRRDENGKDNIASLRESSKGLEEAMKNIFDGKEVDDRLLVELIAKHQENIAAFDDPEAAKSTLKGVDMEVADGRFGFFRRLISRFTTPKVEEYYNFSENKTPASKDDYDDVFYRHEALNEELEETKNQTKSISTEYGKKLKEVATEEQWNDMEKQRAEIAKLKTMLKAMPSKINKTRLDKYEAEVQAAETKLSATPQYKVKADSKDIDDRIADLTTKLNAEPDKIEDPEKAASKKRRISEKEAMIEEAIIDATDPRRVEIRHLLEELNGEEVQERAKLEAVSNKLNGIMSTLKEKVSLLSMFEVAKQKVMNLIRIKDANKMLDRRSGRIAEDLVNATRPQRPAKDSRAER